MHLSMLAVRLLKSFVISQKIENFANNSVQAYFEDWIVSDLNLLKKASILFQPKLRLDFAFDFLPDQADSILLMHY